MSKNYVAILIEKYQRKIEVASSNKPSISDNVAPFALRLAIIISTAN